MSNGWMPGAILKPIPLGSNDPQIVPIGVDLHVAVSQSDSLYDYFAHKSGGIESHFYVRYDGTIEQYRSIFYEADAQDQGNSFMRGGKRCGFVSVESEGMGEGKWTWNQIEAFKKIIYFVRRNNYFPLRVAPAWNAPGIGYHSLFAQWNPNGHSCPGPDRIRQFKNTLVPWFTFPVVHLKNFRLGKFSDDALYVKRVLKTHGYSGFRTTGPGSRGWGRGAIRAYKEFEARNKLLSNGKPDSRSLQLLGFRAI